MKFSKITSLKTPEQFAERLRELGLNLPWDRQLMAGADSPLAQPIVHGPSRISNRFAILPMEGWDGTSDGRPSDLTRRRWQRFGSSGAKWIWGGEAVAVREDGRANPNQLLISDHTLADLESLLQELTSAHSERFGEDDLFIGLQLTHSGRFARPYDNRELASRLVYRHPFLDERFGLTEDNSRVLSDDELYALVDEFVQAAGRAAKIGFQFVDIKHCHGYLGHELLSAYDRTGDFGGSFENRTRFIREVVEGIRAVAPQLKLGVRVSIFDFCPFVVGANGLGEPVSTSDYRFGFGCDKTGRSVDLNEPFQFIQLLKELDVRLVCTTAGSPYYNPHIQRPAAYPPSDGYLPPEDPLVGVARQIEATANLKRQFPEMVFLGSGYSYLQEWFPHVAQAAVREGWVDAVGLGRAALSYPDLPHDVLRGVDLQKKKVCRTFSDCTTAPRNGMVSGCYPLDPFYKAMPERKQLVELKRATEKQT